MMMILSDEECVWMEERVIGVGSIRKGRILKVKCGCIRRRSSIEIAAFKS